MALEHTKTVTALANFLSELAKDGYLVLGDEMGGLTLYEPEGSAVALYEQNANGIWIVQDLQYPLKDMEKER